jgi:hypothetical protein
MCPLLLTDTSTSSYIFPSPYYQKYNLPLGIWGLDLDLVFRLVHVWMTALNTCCICLVMSCNAAMSNVFAWHELVPSEFSNQCACWRLSFRAVWKYSMFLWSIHISSWCLAPSKKCLHSSNAHTMIKCVLKMHGHRTQPRFIGWVMCIQCAC